MDFLLRLGCALLCGMAIGVERQWRQRTAGLRTYTLVATGSAHFVMVAVLTPGEASPTLRTIIESITRAAFKSPVANDTPASTTSTPLKGCRIAPQSTTGQPGGFWLDNSFGPNCASRRRASVQDNPSGLDRNRSSVVAASACVDSDKSLNNLTGVVVVSDVVISQQ